MFYDAALKPLGCVRVWNGATSIGYAIEGAADDRFAIRQAPSEHCTPPAGLHIAFSACSHEAVHAFHTAALALGATNDGSPAVHAEYGPHYFAAFVIDPDGYRIEAVCHRFETQIVEATDADFPWMLTGGDHPSRSLKIDAARVDAAIIGHVRRITQRLHESGCRQSWMMVCDGEAVGLCGYTSVPTDGIASIGYNVWPGQQQRGHATRAVKEIIAAAKHEGLVTMLTAETALYNSASQRVLEANAFMRAGTRRDREDGELVLWRLPLNA